MARYSDEELRRLKESVDLVALVRSKGIVLEKHGKDLKGLCPFHKDTSPSLVVTPAKNLYRCVSCGEGGDVIQFVMRHDGLSFRHAVELLRDDPSLVMGGEMAKRTSVAKLQPPVELDADDQAQLRGVVDFYHERLKATQPAKDYLKKRGIWSEEAVERFKLGYSDRTLGLRLPDKKRVGGKAMREQLQKIGILRKKTGHEQLAGCLTIPVFIPPGTDQKSDDVAVGEVYGRRIVKDKVKHLYLDGPHRGVWNADALDDDVVLCESLIDALSCWVCGLRSVTAAYGCHGLTDEIVETLVNRRVKRVRIAYDADDAGNKGAESAAAKLAAKGIDVYRVKLPLGQDVNVVLCSQGGSDLLRKLIASAQWLDIRGAAPNPAKGDCVPLGTPHLAGSCPVDTSTEQAPARVAPEDSKPEPCPEGAETPRRGAKAELCPDQKVADSAARAGASLNNKQLNKPLKKESPSQAAPQAVADSGGESADSAPSPQAKVEAADTPPNPAPAQPNTGVLRGTRPPEPPEASLVQLGDYWLWERGERSYRVGGVEKNNGVDSLRVTLRLRHGEDFHLDSLDLAQDGHRRKFVERAVEETGLEKSLVKRDLGRLLLALEQLQHERLTEKVESVGNPVDDMTDDERKEALAFLQSPDLISRIDEAFDVCGLVGEKANRLAAYLACTSRKLDRPLAVIIQSTSAAGKSTLMEAVLAMFPSEERVQYSAMTGQSLYYLGESNLKHNILAISEEEGAEKASYALKLLQSEGELTIASTGKDPKTGRMETQEYRVEGPVMIFLTTTAIDVDEELQNRCLTLSVDESAEQTRRIHDLQRKSRTLDGLRLKKEKKRMLGLLTNVQRLIEPVDVVNPYADQLTFTAGRTRTRRDHEKYLTLIDAIALLHQHQRPKETLPGDSRPFIRVTVDDVALANRLAPDLLGRSLDDLPPQPRRMLDGIKDLVRERAKAEEADYDQILFSRRDVRLRLGWSVTQTRMHLERLQEHECLAPRRGVFGNPYLYQLLIDPEVSDKATIGLLNVEKLRLRHGGDGFSCGGDGVVTGW